MARLLVYYAHPGHRASKVNRPMAEAAQQIGGIEFVDLYRLYPRFNIDIDAEQARVLTADVILFQFPLFWYSTPPLIKEWIDLVLEHGFAYGAGGDKVAGKIMMLAITAGGPEQAYSPEGYQRYPLRTFLTPLEQTARLCGMRFAAPYALYASLNAKMSGRAEQHVAGYQRLLQAIRDDAYDFGAADAAPFVTFATMPVRGES